MNGVLGLFLSVVFLNLLAMLLLCLVLWISHRLLCRREARLLFPGGVMKAVNGHRVHLVLRGSSPDLVVLLSGGGSCAPALDYLPLADALEPGFSTVIIEHAGTGYSEDTNLPRDVDTLVREDREALRAVGLLPPYILVAHSMAGLEALRWEQLYPGELLGIIGIDMALPQVYYHAQINRAGVWAGRLSAELGFARLFPQVLEAQPALAANRLSDAQKAEFRALYYRKSRSKAALAEAKEVWNSAKTVQESGEVSLPMLLFVSDGRWISLQEDAGWVGLQREFAARQPNRRFVELSCGHYIHQYQPQELADAMTEWIQTRLRAPEGAPPPAES